MAPAHSKQQVDIFTLARKDQVAPQPQRETMMERSRSGLLTVGAALAVVVLAAGAAAAAPIQAPAAVAVEVTQVAPPDVHITMNRHGVPKTADAFDFRPGLIRVTVDGHSNCPLWFIRLHDGYAFEDFRRDQYAMFTGDLRARQRLWDNSDYLGGVTGRAGQTVTGTVTLPSAGAYVIAAFGKYFDSPIRFRLTGDPEDRGVAAYDSTIVATASGGWDGDTQLPTSGTLRFTNNDSVPHQLYLQPVVDGTTAEQLLAWFRDNPVPRPGHGSNSEPPPPPWLAPGPRLGMMPLDPGATETRTYADYAPGTYLAWEQIGWEQQFPPTMIAIVHIGD